MCLFNSWNKGLGLGCLLYFCLIVRNRIELFLKGGEGIEKNLWCVIRTKFPKKLFKIFLLLQITVGFDSPEPLISLFYSVVISPGWKQWEANPSPCPANLLINTCC